MRRLLAFLSLVLFNSFGLSQIPERVQHVIDQGKFSQAQQIMRMELAKNLDLSPEMRQTLIFEIERLERIRKDFTKTRPQVLEYIKGYIPDVTEKDLARWEQEESLECMIIDGEKRYFHKAAPNLFRIDQRAKAIKQKIDGQKPRPATGYDRQVDVQNIKSMAEASGEKFVNPIHQKITYTLRVQKNIIPAGKVIRCWLPFPRDIPLRQTDIRLISTDPERHLIADNEDYLQRTVYLEKETVFDQETIFQVVFEYTSHAVYQAVDPEIVHPTAITEALAPFLEERLPHIVFTPELKTLSMNIVGDEKNPYRIAQRLFQWIDENIPWASAREYSTFKNIDDYVYQHRHGDCGMKTIFFITLCRMNGIPAKWQSGWSTEPGDDGMHDWGEIYFEPYGWLPMDVTYGVMKSENDKIKWFYLGSMDSYRLIVNDDYSRALYPAKIHPRSETIDFQRGEVEWEGGNLYFDQWDYDFDVEYHSDK